MFSKTCVKGPLKNRQNQDLNDKWYVWPALSDNWSWKPIFGLFESGRFTRIHCITIWTSGPKNIYLEVAAFSKILGGIIFKSEALKVNFGKVKNGFVRKNLDWRYLDYFQEVA